MVATIWPFEMPLQSQTWASSGSESVPISEASTLPTTRPATSSPGVPAFTAWVICGPMDTSPSKTVPTTLSSRITALRYTPSMGLALTMVSHSSSRP